MYFGFGAPLNESHGISPHGGAVRATLRDDGLLNRFFPFQCILTKERNALRLDDALLSGAWRGKNRFFTQTAERFAYARPAPPCGSNCIQSSRWRVSRQYRLAVLLWRSSGGRYFACKSGAICPKGCALTKSSLACDVGTPWQAARRPLWEACHRAHSAER